MISTRDLLPERSQGEVRELEVLLPERDPDDRQAQEQTEHEVLDRKLQSRYEEPDDVKEAGYAAAIVLDLLTKRQEGKRGHLEALYPDRRTDDRDAPQAPCDQPGKRTDPAAENDPQNIPQSFHYYILLSNLLISV